MIAEAVQQWDELESRQLEEVVFTQRTRLVNAERSLQTKVTKKAQNDVRIASNKIERALAKLSRLRSDKVLPSDSRIFPGSYAPVITGHGQDRIIRPMRYQCRLAVKPASYDVRFPGTYNARRDSLERYWSNTFGHNHAILIVNKFYEHVARHALEQRELAPDEKEESVILEFTPEPAQEMIIACLWSEWKGPEGRLLSFAAFTDETPPEVAAAGHDRCIVQIKPENIDAWLNPDHRDLAACYEILDDRPALTTSTAWRHEALRRTFDFLGPAPYKYCIFVQYIYASPERRQSGQPHLFLLCALPWPDWDQGELRPPEAQPYP